MTRCHGCNTHRAGLSDCARVAGCISYTTGCGMLICFLFNTMCPSSFFAPFLAYDQIPLRVWRAANVSLVFSFIFFSLLCVPASSFATRACVCVFLLRVSVWLVDGVRLLTSLHITALLATGPFRLCESRQLVFLCLAKSHKATNQWSARKEGEVMVSSRTKWVIQRRQQIPRVKTAAQCYIYHEAEKKKLSAATEAC